jgi:hypothetical protein
VKTLSEKINFIARVFGQYEIARNEKNIAVKCPFCKKQDKKKFVIRLEDYACHCWRCGAHSKNLVFVIRQKSPQHLQEYINDYYVGDKTKISDSDDKQLHVSLPSDFQLLMMCENISPEYYSTLRYLINRDISQEDMWKYKMGISCDSRWVSRVIVPSFDVNGNLNHFVARGTNKKVFPKYDMPDVTKTLIIFNELFVDWKKQLVLCEGVFDAFNCGDNVVPLLGSDLSEESLLFERIVVNNTPVALALDEDMRYTKTPKIIKKLEQYNIDTKFVKIQDDPGSMTKQQFQDALGNATQLNWKQNTQDRLDRLINFKLHL